MTQIKQAATLDMTKGKPYKNIWKFAFPLIIGNVLQQMYNMVDSLVVGNAGEHGTENLAALGASGNVIFLFTAFFIGFSVGATILIAQFIGAQKPEQVQKTVDTVYRTLFILSIPVTALGIGLTYPLLRLLQTPADIIDMAATYMRICFLGIFAIFGFNINSGIMQGMGDSKSPLLFLAVSMLINIALDLIFVFGFGWGVAGAAIATVIAQIISFVFSTLFINRKGVVKIHIFKNSYDSSIMRRVVHLGLPSGLQNVFFTMGFLFLQNLINLQGDAFLAGYTVGNRIDQMSVMLEASFASALTSYVGQNYGAKKFERISQGVGQTMLLSGAMVLTLTGLIMIFSRQIVSLFDRDPEVVRVGQAFIYGVMPFYIVLNMLYLVNSALRGVNRSVVPMIGSLFSIGVRVLTAYWITYRFGAQYMFISYGLGWCFSIVPNSLYYFFGRWRRQMRAAAAAAAGQTPAAVTAEQTHVVEN